MVLASTLCSTVMCILIPSVLYSKSSTLSNLQMKPPQIDANNKMVSGAVNFPTPVDVLLRQLAATNLKVNAPTNGAASDNISIVSQQRPSWLFGTRRPSIKIYGDGTESSLPPFLEFFLQRIQSFFSVYRFQDTSRPEPGSLIKDVEFIEPTKITIRQGGFSRENADESAPFTHNGADLVNDYHDDILGDNAGVIAVGSDI